ncbi:MAG: AMIN domain-containing protein [Deltaproteobacteria bacterium]
MMDSPVHKYAFVGLISLVCLVGTGPSWALPQGNIVGIKVSQDAKHIVIRHEGVADRYSAFAIGSPNRLVIDFKETRLLNVPHKIQVGRKSIKEIRLGYSGSRSRVVVDFGGSPVPPYRLHPESRRLVIVLGKPLQAVRAPSVRSRKPAPVSTQPPKPLKAPAKAPSGKHNKPELSIQSADVKDGLIVLELAKGTHPKRTCRLVLEVDMDRMKVRKATINGGKRNLRSEAPTNSRTNDTLSPRSSKSRRGPRKQAPASAVSAPSRPAYQWGRPSLSVRHRGPGHRAESHAGPLRLEPLTLKKRPSGSES